MAKKELCEKCQAPMSDDHTEWSCMERELAALRKECVSLKKTIIFWKDAWFECREIIGKLWWHHPAIDNDEQREYYQQHLNRNKASAKE
jgi:hypothetical protein